MPQDAAIVKDVQSGNTEAYRLLVDRHQGKLHGILTRMLGDRLLAEELAQEAFVKAYLGIQDFRGEAGFGTWLIQIGIHAARDHLRRQRRRRQLNVVSLDELREARRSSSDPPDERRASDPFDVLDDHQRSELMMRALGFLPFEYREVLVLRHLEGWAYENIAVLTGDTVGTLKVRAHRARKLLKDQLTGLGWEFQSERSARPRDDSPADREVDHA
jgi:RNA polymerase sigma-70 factor (ECF subfamily)